MATSRAKGGTALQPKNDMCRDLGARFRRTREAAGLTLRGMAPEVGVCFYSIRRHEAGTMMLRCDDLVRAAAAMRCNVADLLEVEP